MRFLTLSRQNVHIAKVKATDITALREYPIFPWRELSGSTMYLAEPITEASGLAELTTEQRLIDYISSISSKFGDPNGINLDSK